MNRDDMPGEDEQFEAYRSVVKAHGRQAGHHPHPRHRRRQGPARPAQRRRRPPQSNPALGLRAIRFCLAEPKLFLVQLRAILRASHYGKIKLLIPMLAAAHEIEQTLALIELAKLQLRDARQKPSTRRSKSAHDRDPGRGAGARPLPARLHFLSIGTNDLIQYTLAIDRSDEQVAHLYDPLHPAVLMLMAHTIQSAQRVDMPVSICGEMAGDPKLTRLLLGMGLRQFSMHPAQIRSPPVAPRGAGKDSRATGETQQPRLN
jgi:phosphotransferase system enzyme I (PtsI)